MGAAHRWVLEGCVHQPGPLEQNKCSMRQNTNPQRCHIGEQSTNEAKDNKSNLFYFSHSRGSAPTKPARAESLTISAQEPQLTAKYEGRSRNECHSHLHPGQGLTRKDRAVYTALDLCLRSPLPVCYQVQQPLLIQSQDESRIGLGG